MNFKNLKHTSGIFTILLALILLTAFSNPNNKETVIQIDVKNILNARSVTTLADGKLTTWTTGIDGNGLADGYLTLSAALFNGDKDPIALPDNPLFPSNDRHPEILLHYSNSDSTSNQTLAVKGAGAFDFKVPAKNYSKLFLAFTSAEGASKITVELQYENATESKSFVVPDYYLDVPETDPDFCYLAYNLAKWGVKNNMTEKDHHNIDLLDIHPDPTKKLMHVTVRKSEPGYLVFWAATGVTTK